jgi:hypothetical protein
LKVQDHEIVIHTPRETRAHWAAAFKEMAERGDDEMLDATLPPSSRWDHEEWEW